MTRYYHLDPDMLGMATMHSSPGHAYVYGELVSGWDDDEAENIEFTITRKDVKDVIGFLMEFLERHGDE